VEDHTCCCCG